MINGLTQEQNTVLDKAEQLLREARSDAGFAEAMRTRGYDEAAWSQLEGLIGQLKAAVRSRQEAQSAQLGATNLFNHQYNLCWDHGKILALNCITQFQGQTDWLLMLGLHRRRKDENGDSWIISLQKRSPLPEVIGFLRHLYDIAQNHQEIAAVLAAHGFPPAIVAAGAAEVEAMVAADQAQEAAKVEVKRWREARDEVFSALRKWYVCADRAAVLARKELRRNRVLVQV
jgi:hypothetical protein